MVEFVLSDGALSGGGLRLRAAIGRGGVSYNKTEGDGATPAGLHRLLRVLYRADRLAAPRCIAPVEPLSPGDGWCDDVADARYNRRLTLPDAAGHEALWRDDPAYDVIGVLDWNYDPVAAGRGSAIFLHVATADYAPTAGCVALMKPELLACLAAGLSAVRVI